MCEWGEVMSESVDCLLAENADILRDLAELLVRLDDDAFTSPADPCYGSTIGQQVRHAIEHAEAVLAAPCGSVDFHSRERDTATETIRAVAHRRLNELTEQFDGMRRQGMQDFALKVRHVVDSPDGQRDHWLDTSLSRELAFLQSHSVHHMALIGMMASLCGVSVPEGFGVAPSTRRYWAAQETAGGGDRVLHAASRAD